MNLFFKILALVLVFIVILSVGLYLYYGGFSTIEVKTKEQGGEYFVYKEVIGSYKQTEAVTNEVYYALVKNYNIETLKGAGIFYDNPKQVEESKLRSEIGCLLEPKDTLKITEVQKKFKVKKLPKAQYALAEFPTKNKISVFIGIMKVYPALKKYMSESNYADKEITEIYDVPNKNTIYRIEINQ